MPRGDRWHVEVLGPVRVRDPHGRECTPDGGLQRRLLALLVLHRGREVSVDELVEALWPMQPPRDPVAALQNHVFRLRRGLPAELVESTANGYRLQPDGIEVDADRLAAALRDRDDDPSWPERVDAILDGWQGAAYPELADVDDGRIEAMRLEELRTRAVEARAEHRLQAGDTAGLVAELSALAEREPLRERPRELLMASLAATGRTVEALRVYDDFRRQLADELGIEPSPALAAQHAALLRGADVVSWAPVTRLPAPVTSLVGRDQLVADALAMVEAGRLVTLIGPGGVGKTRLATEVGRRLLAAHADRPVVMCELATANVESTVDAVAAALGIEGRPGVGLSERVVAALDQAEVVLILDNCEHVLDSVAALVEAILLACPHVKVVATSRERLRAPGERLCVVPALPVTADDAPAVRLFIERARAAVPGFEPDERELALIAEIARRLDGLPLAIELAAARLHTLEVAEVAAGLDRRFVLLSSGFRTSPRHGSLAATVAWSYGQLDPERQQVFVDLSTFAGPFTMADAAAVCGVDTATAAASLDQLVERSLVMRAPGRRYVLLETLRAFGAEQALTERSDGAAERHARHFVAWMEDADRGLFESRATPVIADVDAALPELRTALSWSLEHGDVTLAGRLMQALMYYGFLRLRPDVLSWSARVTAADPENASPLAAVVWAVRAFGAWMAGDGAAAGQHTVRARRLMERAGEESPIVLALWGNGALFEGRLDEASRRYQRAAELWARDEQVHRLMGASTDLLPRAYAGEAAVLPAARELLAEIGDSVSPIAAYGWFCAGEAELALGTGEAKAPFQRALELAEPTKTSFVTGAAGASLASIEARHGDPVAAAHQYRHLMTYWRRAGMWPTQWTMLRSVAGLLARLGRPREAAALEAAVRTTTSGHRIFGADALLLGELSTRLRSELGDEAYEAARAEGSELDGDAAVELALRALG